MIVASLPSRSTRDLPTTHSRLAATRRGASITSSKLQAGTLSRGYRSALGASSNSARRRQRFNSASSEGAISTIPGSGRKNA
jgi:hypothetical protein